MVETKWVLLGLGITGVTAYIFGIRDSFTTVKSKMCTNPLDFSTHITSFSLQCPNPNLSDMVSYFGESGTNQLEKTMFRFTAETLK